MSQQAPAGGGHDRQKLFIASCIALVATAMAFAIRAGILGEFQDQFGISHEQLGFINLMGIWGFPIAILLVGPLCDTIGMGKLLKIAAAGHIVGTILTILSPSLGGYSTLLVATLLIGLANGTVEAVINPLTATLYPDQKTHRLNVLHAWWPGGLIIGSLIVYLLKLIGLGWQLQMATIIVVAVIYLIMISGQEFPVTERVASGVSNAEMFRAAMATPGFLLMLLCMCLTAITELGPDQWVGKTISDMTGMEGILLLAYTSGLMFVLRQFAGPIAHKLNPIGMMTAAAVLSAIGLNMLSGVTAAGGAMVAATVFALGKAYFWPTMLAIVSERYPKTGALGLAMMGAFGMFAAGLAGPTMGRIYDNGAVSYLQENAPAVAQVVAPDGHYNAEAAKSLHGSPELQAALQAGAGAAFKAVSLLPLLLFFIFGAMFLKLKAEGGYKAVAIDHEEAGAASEPPPAEAPAEGGEEV